MRLMTRKAMVVVTIVLSTACFHHTGALAQEIVTVSATDTTENTEVSELQARLAIEARRVGRRLYLQTPNRYFPLEPHFLFPFFALFPINVRAFLLQHFDLGWHPRQPDRRAALREVRSVRLMTGRELRRAFPGARIERERILGLTKSFIVLDGWDPQGG